MAKGYASFEDFVREKYITRKVLAKVYQVTRPNGMPMWSDETRSVVYWLSDRGIPLNMVGRLLGIHQSAAHRWFKEEGRDKEEGAREGLVKEWYESTLQQSAMKVVTLDDYTADYNKDLGIRGLVDSLMVLHECGIDFPYAPKPRDAYLFGVNHGRGCLTEDLALRFDGDREDLIDIDLVVPATKCEEDNYISYSQALGRLYHIMGLVRGDRTAQVLSVPEWIRGDRFVSEYLGGLFDTAKSYYKVRNYWVLYALRETCQLDLRKEFEEFIEKIGSMFRSIGIDVPPKGASVIQYPKKRPRHLLGRVKISTRRKNLAKARERLKTKVRSTKRFFKSVLSEVA
ncbi:MAG: hypothetical protein JSW18_05725 [Candidatus Omnitrophota bacterium]|nr:MAG: hypothetical protein JSW18_05725 [Candidatus Omnitrophota bacterium]